MSSPTYSFLPWVRQGLGNLITAADGAAGVRLRANIPVDLELTGEGISPATTQPVTEPQVSLAGPGDVVGIDPRAVIRTEPRNWITNFEPNYMPFVEFYDEDFPWRYTPAVPNGHRLRPWIALVVLADGEFDDISFVKARTEQDEIQSLPSVRVTNAAAFPPKEQLWAWAHVHMNRGVTGDGIKTTAMDTALPRVKAVLDENPDLAYSRLMCPRKLGANTGYHAFVMPVFETGRLAGLGLDPAAAPSATHCAWEPYAARDPKDNRHPYYYRWYFRTGVVGDFEYLVRLLEPRTVDKRVGVRDIDVQHPDPNVRGITGGDLGGVLKLGGALRVPRMLLNPQELADIEKYENWESPYPEHPFQQDLASLINLADEYTEATPSEANAESDLGQTAQSDPDPLVTPPLYGRWHSLTRRLLTERDGSDAYPRDNWVHELNLDPRHRAAAGFGTRVIRQGQEEYMNAAWAQLGDVLAAQQRIRDAQLAKQLATVWYERHLQPLAAVNVERAFQIIAPVHARVLRQGQAVDYLMRNSVLSRTLVSAPMRRALRPRARMMRALPFNATARPDTLLRRVNAGLVSAAPPKVRPSGIATVGEIASGTLPRIIPGFIADWLRRFLWLPFLVLLLGLLLALAISALLGAGVAALAVAAAALVLYALLRYWLRAVQRGDMLNDDVSTPAGVDRMPRSPDFALSRPADGVTPHTGSEDSPEATRFKTGIRSSRTLIAASKIAARKTPRQAIDVTRVANQALAAIDPRMTIPQRTLASLHLPERLRALVVEKFREPLAYPEFDSPMYRPLADISPELFLPNIHLVEDNSITLLESNQAFIEAYMVGINHELAIEFLWREYFTDQRGSPCRQFWDVSAYLDVEGTDLKTLREKLRDIPPLHRWPRVSNLGDHDHRGTPGEKKEEVVLTIRGELLKRYPNAVIYAHRARWKTANGRIDPSQERELEPIVDGDTPPPRTTVKTPLYEAKVQPDVFFFGFDLTAEQAKGGTGEDEDDDPGWFFVIKERPGEPRFGLDVDQGNELSVWNDLSWEDVLPGAAAGTFIQVGGAAPAFTLQPPGAASGEKTGQHAEDVQLQWNQNISSAELAYMLLQAPVLVAVHAAEMLKSGVETAAADV